MVCKATGPVAGESRSLSKDSCSLRRNAQPFHEGDARKAAPFFQPSRQTLGVATHPLSTYGLQTVSTGRSVHFIDEEPALEDLRELADELRAKQVHMVYLDCAEYTERKCEILNVIGYAAATDHPPYYENKEANWLRWSDDLLSLGSHSMGLVIILDNASPLFSVDRKFMTNLLENFLHAQRSWFGRGAPYHLCIQMTPCPAVKEVFSGHPNSRA